MRETRDNHEKGQTMKNTMTHADERKSEMLFCAGTGRYNIEVETTMMTELKSETLAEALQTLVHADDEITMRVWHAIERFNPIRLACYA
jgi:hypothetical protein